MTTVTHRICLWSGPRNISTALMYAFAQRADTLVFDEPLYAHYLVNTPAREYHPAAEEVIATMENDGQKVVDNLILGPHPRPILFFKHMTHHLVNLDYAFMKNTINIILTRDPRDMLPSYAIQIETPQLHDTGYPQHIELLNYLQDLGQDVPILDAKKTLLNPERVLTKLCDQIGIPFTPAMLSWPAGPRPEDGIWAPHWYHAVHQSTGFQPYQPKTKPFPDKLKPLLSACQPYYEQLTQHAIQ
ncbi:MAG TPA: sulfotransferase family protein [Anaerolineae bacterium]|nr:sulfotransferase family protein [Anaerolineae bacterium]